MSSFECREVTIDELQSMLESGLAPRVEFVHTNAKGKTYPYGGVVNYVDTEFAEHDAESPRFFKMERRPGEYRTILADSFDVIKLVGFDDDAD